MASTVHLCWTRYFRAERFTTDAGSLDGIRAAGKQAFWSNLQELDDQMAWGPWFIGEQFTVCDSYALVFYVWARYGKMPVSELANYSAWAVRMLARPAVRRTFDHEGIPIN